MVMRFGYGVGVPGILASVLFRSRTVRTGHSRTARRLVVVAAAPLDGVVLYLETHANVSENFSILGIL